MDNKSEEDSKRSKRQSSDSESADIPRHQSNSGCQTAAVSENGNNLCGQLCNNSPPRPASHESSISSAIGSTEIPDQFQSISNTQDSNTEQQPPNEEQRLSGALANQYIENRNKGRGKAIKRSSDSSSDSDQSLKRQKTTPEPVNSQISSSASDLDRIVESPGMKPRSGDILIRSLDDVPKNPTPSGTRRVPPPSSHDFRTAHPCRPKSGTPLSKIKGSALDTDAPEDAPSAPLRNSVLDNVGPSSKLAQNAGIVASSSPEKESRKQKFRRLSTKMARPVTNGGISKFRAQRKREKRGELKQIRRAAKLDTISRSMNGLKRNMRQARREKERQKKVEAENHQKESYYTVGEENDTQAMTTNGKGEEYSLNPAKRSLDIPDHSRSYNPSLTVGMAMNRSRVNDESLFSEDIAFFAALPAMRRNYPEFAPVFTDSDEMSLNGGASERSTDSNLPELVIDSGTSEDEIRSGAYDAQPATPGDTEDIQDLRSRPGMTGENTGTGGLRTRPPSIPSIPSDGNVLQSFLDPSVSPSYDASDESSRSSYSSSTRNPYFPDVSLVPAEAGTESNTEQEQREPHAIDASNAPQEGRVEQGTDGPAPEIGNPMIGTNYQRVTTNSPASGYGIEDNRTQRQLVAPWHVEGDRLTPNAQVEEGHGRSYEFETMHLPENGASRDQLQIDQQHEGVVSSASRRDSDLMGGSSMERRRIQETLVDQEWRPDEYERDPELMENAIPSQYDGVAGGVEQSISRWSWESAEPTQQAGNRHHMEHIEPVPHEDNMHYVEHVERSRGEQTEFNGRTNEHELRDTNTEVTSPSQYQEMAGETETRTRTKARRIVAIADRLRGRREQPTPQEDITHHMEPIQREGEGEQSEMNTRTDEPQREVDARRTKRGSNIRNMHEQDNTSQNTSSSFHSHSCCLNKCVCRTNNETCNVMMTSRLPSPPRGLNVWADTVSNRKTLEMLGFLPDENEMNVGRESSDVAAIRPRLPKDNVVDRLPGTSPKSIHLCLNDKKGSSQVEDKSEDCAMVQEIAGSSDRYWAFDIENIHCPTCYKIMQDQKRRDGDKATGWHSRREELSRHQHCVNSLCHETCDHELRPHHVLSRFGLDTTHKIRRVQLISSSPNLDPDVLASAIMVLKSFFGQLQGLELILAMPKPFTRSNTMRHILRQEARHFICCFVELEGSLLVQGARLKIRGLEEFGELEEMWWDVRE